jgi:hypothetical protein
MLPKTAGKYDFDYTFTKPVLFGGASLWAGSWGLSGEYTALPALYNGPSLALAAGPMYDGQIKWRCSEDMNQVGFGWRGLGTGTAAAVNLGTLSYGLNIPLGTDVVVLKLSALGGSNFGSGWLADGKAGLGLNLGPITLDGGYRMLGMNNILGITSPLTTHAPYVGAGLRF